MVTLLTSETYKKIILERRAKKLGLVESLTSGSPSGLQKAKFLLTVTLFRPIHMLFTEPIVGVYSMYTAFNFAILFAFFAAYPYVFQGTYGFNLWQYGLTFLGIGLGVLIAAATGIFMDRVLYQKEYRRALAQGKSVVAPEHRYVFLFVYFVLAEREMKRRGHADKGRLGYTLQWWGHLDCQSDFSGSHGALKQMCIGLCQH